MSNFISGMPNFKYSWNATDVSTENYAEPSFLLMMLDSLRVVPLLLKPLSVNVVM